MTASGLSADDCLRELCTSADAELFVDHGRVVLDRLPANAVTLCDGTGCVAHKQTLEDLLLARSQQAIGSISHARTSSTE